MGEGIVANLQRSRGRGQKFFIHAPQLYSPDHAPALVKCLVVKSVVCHVQFLSHTCMRNHVYATIWLCMIVIRLCKDFVPSLGFI